MGKPNVIILVTHDTGQFISPYGYPTVNTPACERLAAEGQVFTNSFCTSPLCSPSRSSIFTGRHPHQNGVMGLTSTITGGWGFFPDERHAAKLFTDAGYESVLCGFEHESMDFTTLGFSNSIHGTGNDHNGDESILGAGNAIDRWLTERVEKTPFYLQIGSPETHRRENNFFGTGSDNRNGVWMPPYLRKDPELEGEMAALQGAVNQFDTGLGGILDALDKHNLAQNTIFIATTDHGIDVPRAKGTCYDPGIETFLIARYTEKWAPRKIHNHLISNIDILPTLLQACEIPIPDSIAGKSFLPLLENKPYSPNEYIFSGKTFHDNYDPVRAIRSEKYKFIKNFEVSVLYDVRLGTLPRYKYFKGPLHKRTAEELFDLEADPTEEHNLILDLAYSEKADSMRKALAEWMEATADPILQGPVSSPLYRNAIHEMQLLIRGSR